jgi:hypothetical protein
LQSLGQASGGGCGADGLNACAEPRKGRTKILGTIYVGSIGAIVAVLIACAPTANTPPREPTREAAIAYFGRVVDLVERGDVLAICTLGSGTCAHDIRNADLTAVPRTLPTVIGTRLLASTQEAGGTWNIGGQVLEVCGIDGHNRPFYSELLVFYDGDRLISTNPLYWSGSRVATSDTTDQSASPPCG